MAQVISFAIVIMTLTFLSPAHAYIDIEGSTEFQKQVRDYLLKGKIISPHTKRLIEELANSSRRISIAPITKDPSSKHPRGDPKRSHTRATKAKYKKRQRPVDAVIYINKNRINKDHKSYSQGTLIHELVHAYDLVAGLYHRDFKVREKRAVFFQNIWRQGHSKRLRTHYHRKFETMEYQQALNNGRIGAFVDHFFAYNDLP